MIKTIEIKAKNGSLGAFNAKMAAPQAYTHQKAPNKNQPNIGGWRINQKIRWLLVEDDR